MQAHGFRVCFTPLTEVLFTFPSRYLCAIGLSVVFSLAGWSPLIPAEFLVLRGTQVPPDVWIISHAVGGPTTPGDARDVPGLGCCAFARHYLRNRCYFLFLRVLRCFSSPGSLHDLVAVPGSLLAGFPIRTSAGHRAFAPHRGFSQLITSFIASESHRHPPCALVHFLCSFALATPALARRRGRTFAYIRLARFFRFSQLNRLIFLVLRSHHVNDLFKNSRSPRQT